MTNQAIPAWAVPGATLEPAKVRHGVERVACTCACGNHVFAPITGGYMTMVSPEDAGVFNRKWAASKRRGHVAVARVLWPERTSQLMHRLILNAPPDKHVDHVNGDQLDNRRSNLRLCIRDENMWNRKVNKDKKSGLPKGVSPKRDKFAAAITKHGKKYRLGSYFTPEEAHEAYCRASKEMHGEFARTE